VQLTGGKTPSTIGGGTISSHTFGSTSTSEGSGAGLSGSLHSLGSSLGGIGGASAGASTFGMSNSTCALFGVFDGHGGIEVAEFCQRHFEQTFKANPHY